MPIGIIPVSKGNYKISAHKNIKGEIKGINKQINKYLIHPK